jgi:pyridinium-3,5-biscarboxylic acid mononucleotide sulfurtransferase
MHKKRIELERVLRELGSVVVCFSGGLDSSFLLKVAVDVLGAKAVAISAVGPSFPTAEKREAERIANALGARLIFAESREMRNPDYLRNPSNRCYYCKTDLYALAAEYKTQLGFAQVVDGSTTDDLGDYRPGLMAAREAGIRSPLLEVRLSKSEVSEMAREMGLDFHDKPASACLASRIPYGTSVTAEKLSQIERLENALHQLGLRQVRVRFHNELARIEVAASEMEAAFAARETITREGRAAGFTYVTLDLTGYRTGSLNELLSPDKKTGQPPSPTTRG